MTRVAALVDAAFDYGARGVPIFPVWAVVAGRCRCGHPACDNPGKHPLGPLVPNGFKNATTDPALIRQWWAEHPTANIATPTSWCAVLDVDPRKGGDLTLAELERHHGALPNTAEVLTGGGGRHCYFQPVPGLRCSTNIVGAGLDIRAEGGYVLLPPSSHVSGGHYADELDHPLFETPLAAMPTWLIALAAPETTNGRPAAAPLEDTILEGARNATLASLAGTMRRRGMQTPEITAALLEVNRRRCQPPLLESEVQEIAASISRYAAAARDGDDPAPDQHASDPAPYLETLGAFLAEADPPLRVIFPDLLPCDVIMLTHGEPRARKSLAAFELALAAATGTPPFGLERFRPAGPVTVLYIQEEDPRQLTRARLRRLVHDRCGATVPTTLHVAVRRGVDLDDPVWVQQLIVDLTRLDARLLVLDAARRLSTKTDEGPAKVRELMAALRSIVTGAGVAIVVVHHDIKPPTTGQDLRRRGQRASGGDWFAGCECPVHIERLNERDSLVFPQDYKFSVDPAPFTFSCQLDGRLISRLVGRDTTADHAETAGQRGKLLDWLRSNGPASKTTMKKAGFGWETITPLLDGLLRDGTVDAAPGRTAKSSLYFVRSDPSAQPQDSSPRGQDDAR